MSPNGRVVYTIYIFVNVYLYDWVFVMSVIQYIQMLSSNCLFRWYNATQSVQSVSEIMYSSEISNTNNSQRYIYIGVVNVHIYLHRLVATTTNGKPNIMYRFYILMCIVLV